MSESIHQHCHDLVCNASRDHARGASGVGCSCDGRDAAYAELRALRVENTRLRLAMECLRNIVEIGKRDMSNPKYDPYFEKARQVLRAFEPLTHEGDV